MKPLVSIVTPCLNGEKFISNYFDSILNQTYKQIELIFVDDGSTDNTKSIVKQYIEKFMSVNIKLKYIYQDHGGQAKALKLGLKYVTGKYLIWPDSDDILESSSIEKRVDFLEKNNEYGFVRSNGKYVDYKTNKIIGRISNSENRFNSDIFLDLILENTFCSCGCYMIKTKLLKEIYPTWNLYESSAGQNWQILIPYSAKALCGYIDEDLYTIRVRNDSHSNMIRNENESIIRMQELKEILINSVKISNRTDKDYISIIDKKYQLKLFMIYYDFGNRYMADIQYQALKKFNLLDIELYKMYLRKFHKVRFNLYRPIWQIKKYLKIK